MIGVIGAGDCNNEIHEIAHEAGFKLATRKHTIICGGLGGVMESVCKGARDAGGLTIGILPGDDPATANAYVDIAIATGIGLARNIIIVRSAQAILAIDGSYGTLSEIAFAIQLHRPVIGIKTWNVSENITHVASVDEAVSELDKIVGKV
jgi:uncharacterized protein (TIGR00725 family)